MWRRFVTWFTRLVVASQIKTHWVRGEDKLYFLWECMPVPIFFQIRNRLDNAFTRCFINYRPPPSQGHLHIVLTCLEFCKINKSIISWLEQNTCILCEMCSGLAHSVHKRLEWLTFCTRNDSCITLINYHWLGRLHQIFPVMFVFFYLIVQHIPVCSTYPTQQCYFIWRQYFSRMQQWLDLCYSINVTIPEAQPPPCFIYFTSHPLPYQLCIFTTLTLFAFYCHHISFADSNYRLKPVIISLSCPSSQHVRLLTL